MKIRTSPSPGDVTLQQIFEQESSLMFKSLDDFSAEAEKLIKMNGEGTPIRRKLRERLCKAFLNTAESNG